MSCYSVQDGRTDSILKILFVPGAFADGLLRSGCFSTICDSTLAAIDLWSLASADLFGYIEKAAQRSRLRDKNLDDCIQFCLTPDFTQIIPVMKNGFLVPLLN